jgi:phospholipase/carboxylesterase
MRASTTTTLSGPVQPPLRGQARHLVVLLHGWGADGNDLIGLAPAWARQLPDARFVAPHAPDPCDQNPMGRQWFSFVDSRPEALAKGAERARALIDGFLDAELQRLSLGDERLALVGFSQGAMMALYVALRRARRCAAVVGYSGALIDDGLAGAVVSRPPVLLVHGDADTMMPIASLHAALAGLGAAEIPVQFHIARGQGHGIDEEGLALGGAFLQANLGQNAAA